MSADGRSAPAPASSLKRSAPSRLAYASGCEIFDQAWESADAMHAEPSQATRYVDVAGQRWQHGECADGLDAFGRVLDRAPPFQHGRLGAREQPRQPPRIFSAVTQVKSVPPIPA